MCTLVEVDVDQGLVDDVYCRLHFGLLAAPLPVERVCATPYHSKPQ